MRAAGRVQRPRDTAPAPASPRRHAWHGAPHSRGAGAVPRTAQRAATSGKRLPGVEHTRRRRARDRQAGRPRRTADRAVAAGTLTGASGLPRSASATRLPHSASGFRDVCNTERPASRCRHAAVWLARGSRQRDPCHPYRRGEAGAGAGPRGLRSRHHSLPALQGGARCRRRAARPHGDTSPGSTKGVADRERAGIGRRSALSGRDVSLDSRSIARGPEPFQRLESAIFQARCWHHRVSTPPLRR
jgi:hypothetical protein